MFWLFLLCVGLFALPARACEIALLLAVDVSGSVDRQEYHIQMQGLADGLRDGTVSESLVAGEAAVSVIQWTGTSRQIVAVPWVRISSFETVETLARQVETAPRRWRNYSTAIGEALLFSLAQFDAVPDCERRVIDVSGDGSSNEGIPPRDTHARLNAAMITVNALVIEGAEPDMTGYYWENVIIGPDAFVITANSYEEYPDRMRRKLQREVTKQVAKRCADQTAHLEWRGKPHRHSLHGHALHKNRFNIICDHTFFFVITNLTICDNLPIQKCI